jgi:hypothetical protein
LKITIFLLYNSNGYYSSGFTEKGGKMMEKSTTIQEIVERLDKLTPVQQKQILNSVLSFLGEPIRGTPVTELLKFAGTISKEDAEIMKQTIEEGCGMASLSQGQHTEKH